MAASLGLVLAGCSVAPDSRVTEPDEMIDASDLEEASHDDGGASEPEEPSPPPPGWHASFELVEIPTIDGDVQPAVFRRAQAPNRPLVVVLHTWGGDFSQAAYSLQEQAVALDWNYIHPDFRGPNDHREACCSALALDDIERAFAFAVERTDADRDRVHLVGVSGGAYATLCSFMTSAAPFASYVAFNGVTDLAAWRDELIGLGETSYVADVEACVDAPPESFVAAARPRSPLYQDATPSFLAEKLGRSRLLLFAGMVDGRPGKGTVPPLHTVHIYNRIVGELVERDGAETVDEPELVRIVDAPETFVPTGRVVADRDVLLERGTASGSLSLVVFDGAHEWLEPVIVEHVEGGA